MVKSALAPFFGMLACVVVAGSCGGESSGGDAGGSAGAGTSSGGASGSSGAAGSAAAGRSGAPGSSGAAGSAAAGSGARAGSGATAGSGGATTINPACQQPQLTGPCNAYFMRFWHNPATGACEQFVYGGCGANDNNFETLAACQGACGSSAGVDTSCNVSADCTLIPRGGGACEPHDRGDYVAVNTRFGGGDTVVDPCPAVDPRSATGQNFIATCEAGRCQVTDIRETELTSCSGPDSCVLRAGMGCCERCDSSSPVAIARGVDVAAELDCPELACPPCAPVYPPGVSAQCDAGRCEVLWLR